MVAEMLGSGIAGPRNWGEGGGEAGGGSKL
jgi:hypothetical protein